MARIEKLLEVLEHELIHSKNIATRVISKLQKSDDLETALSWDGDELFVHSTLVTVLQLTVDFCRKDGATIEAVQQRLENHLMNTSQFVVKSTNFCKNELQRHQSAATASVLKIVKSFTDQELN